MYPPCARYGTLHLGILSREGHGCQGLRATTQKKQRDCMFDNAVPTHKPDPVCYPRPAGGPIACRPPTPVDPFPKATAHRSHAHPVANVIVGAKRTATEAIPHTWGGGVEERSGET